VHAAAKKRLAEIGGSEYKDQALAAVKVFVMAPAETAA
jgi:hypothetical protein